MAEKSFKEKHNLRFEDWRELIQRLLDYGVLCRDDSLVEAELYDRFVRIHALVNDYLALMGVRFAHDAEFKFVRILPPGASSDTAAGGTEAQPEASRRAQSAASMAFMAG